MALCAKASGNALARTCGSNAELHNTIKDRQKCLSFIVVGGGGFEPPKSETSDLQSDAFGHSAIRPN